MEIILVWGLNWSRFESLEFGNVDIVSYSEIVIFFFEINGMWVEGIKWVLWEFINEFVVVFLFDFRVWIVDFVFFYFFIRKG